MTEFSVVQASMRWSLTRHPAFVTDVQAYEPGTLVVALTEIGGLTDAELQAAAGTWRVSRGPNLLGQDECAILYHPSLTPAGRGYDQVLSNLQYFAAGADTPFHKFYAHVQPLQHPDGTVVTYIAIHMPLRNTSRPRYTKTIDGRTYDLAGRVQVSDDCYAFLGRWLPTIAGPKVVLADWNTSFLHDLDVLAKLARDTGMTWAWTNNVDPSDLRWHRDLIDGVLTNLTVRESTLLPPIIASDHQAARVDLTLSSKSPARPKPPAKPKPLPVPGDSRVDWPAYGAPVAHPWARQTTRWKVAHPALWRKIVAWRASYLKRRTDAGAR